MTKAGYGMEEAHHPFVRLGDVRLPAVRIHDDWLPRHLGINEIAEFQIMLLLATLYTAIVGRTGILTEGRAREIDAPF